MGQEGVRVCTCMQLCGHNVLCTRAMLAVAIQYSETPHSSLWSACGGVASPALNSSRSGQFVRWQQSAYQSCLKSVLASELLQNVW